MSSSSTGSLTLEMDVDGEGPPVSAPGTLKRCSSAPMINETNSIMTTVTPSTSSTSREQQNFTMFGASPQPRTRRFSASFSPVPGSPVSGLRRIHQLRQEEDVRNLREVAHERETHNAMQISQSWEDLSLMNDSDAKNNKMGFLHVTLPTFNFMSNSPSPTRRGSPGFQSPTRGSRTLIRRSCSPVLRPSQFGVKRKLDDDKQQDYNNCSRAKRMSYSERGGLLTTTTTASNSFPGSLSSVGTPESLSSADSPGFNFRNVDSPSPGAALNNPEPMVVSKGDEMMNDSPS